MEPKGKLNDADRPGGSEKLSHRAGFHCLWANMWSRGSRPKKEPPNLC